MVRARRRWRRAGRPPRPPAHGVERAELAGGLGADRGARRPGRAGAGGEVGPVDRRLRDAGRRQADAQLDALVGGALVPAAVGAQVVGPHEHAGRRQRHEPPLGEVRQLAAEPEPAVECLVGGVPRPVPRRLDRRLHRRRPGRRQALFDLVEQARVGLVAGEEHPDDAAPAGAEGPSRARARRGWRLRSTTTDTRPGCAAAASSAARRAAWSSWLTTASTSTSGRSRSASRPTVAPSARAASAAAGPWWGRARGTAVTSSENVTSPASPSATAMPAMPAPERDRSGSAQAGRGASVPRQAWSIRRSSPADTAARPRAASARAASPASSGGRRPLVAVARVATGRGGLGRGGGRARPRVEVPLGLVALEDAHVVVRGGGQQRAGAPGRRRSRRRWCRRGGHRGRRGLARRRAGRRCGRGRDEPRRHGDRDQYAHVRFPDAEPRHVDPPPASPSCPRWRPPIPLSAVDSQRRPAAGQDGDRPFGPSSLLRRRGVVKRDRAPSRGCNIPSPRISPPAPGLVTMGGTIGRAPVVDAKRAWAATAASAALVVLTSAGPATAGDAPPLTVDPSSGVPGETVTASGADCGRGIEGRLQLGDTVVVELVVDPTASFPVPDVDAGAYDVTLWCPGSGDPDPVVDSGPLSHLPAAPIDDAVGTTTTTEVTWAQVASAPFTVEPATSPPVPPPPPPPRVRPGRRPRRPRRPHRPPRPRRPHRPPRPRRPPRSAGRVGRRPRRRPSSAHRSR